jgi:hypothetical protein
MDVICIYVIHYVIFIRSMDYICRPIWALPDIYVADKKNVCVLEYAGRTIDIYHIYQINSL